MAGALLGQRHERCFLRVKGRVPERHWRVLVFQLTNVSSHNASQFVVLSKPHQAPFVEPASELKVCVLIGRDSVLHTVL
jgi:hypothetical protein